MSSFCQCYVITAKKILSNLTKRLLRVLENSLCGCTEAQATFILKLGPTMQLSTLLRAKFPLLVKVLSETNTVLVTAAMRKQKSSIRKACVFVICSMTFYLFSGVFLYFVLLCPDVCPSLSVFILAGRLICFPFNPALSFMPHSVSLFLHCLILLYL